MDRQIIWILKENWGKFKEIIIELNVKINRKKVFKGEIKDFCVFEIIENWVRKSFSEKEIKVLKTKISKLKKRGSFRSLPEYMMVNLHLPFEKLKPFRIKIFELFKIEVTEKSLSVCFKDAIENWFTESQVNRIKRLSKIFEKK